MGGRYSGSFFCTNCKWTGEIQVEKGTSLADFADEIECPNCGCDTIHSS